MVLKVTVKGDKGTETIASEAKFNEDVAFVVERKGDEYLVISVNEDTVVIGHTKGKDKDEMIKNYKASPKYVWESIVPKLGEASESLLDYVRLMGE